MKPETQLEKFSNVVGDRHSLFCVHMEVTAMIPGNGESIGVV